MSLDQAYEEIKKIKKELVSRIDELSKIKPFLNDTYHEILKLDEKIKDEINRLKMIRKEIDKKLSSSEFEFIKNNFDITKEDLDPDKYKSYDEISYILKIKTYHAYNWDFFLDPWIKYYEILNKVKLYLKEFKNNVKIIEFYTKLGPFSMSTIDSLISD